MLFDKQQVLSMIRDPQQAEQAAQQLPDQIDHEQHGDMLQQFGVDPNQLAGMGGGQGMGGGYEQGGDPGMGGGQGMGGGYGQGDDPGMGGGRGMGGGYEQGDDPGMGGGQGVGGDPGYQQDDPGYQ
jgi:hypothetical protein